MSSPTDLADDPAARGARAAARRLAPESGAGLIADVEAALHTPGTGRPEQYLDPVSLGSLIVAVASLAWTVYTDLTAKAARPTPQVITRRVRAELADQAAIESADRDRIIDIVVEETIPTDET